MQAGVQAFGIPQALLQSVPALSGEKRSVLRLGHLPRLARLAPHALDEGPVPIREVEHAAAILATNGCEPSANPPPRLRGGAASAALASLRAAAADAFAASIPHTFGEEREGPGNGLGLWLNLYFFAFSVLHLSRDAALAMPLGELFALSAANAAALGATFKAPTYAERDLLDALDEPCPGEVP